MRRGDGHEKCEIGLAGAREREAVGSAEAFARMDQEGSAVKSNGGEQEEAREDGKRGEEEFRKRANEGLTVQA
jgi:hypothetical protein